MVTVISDNIVTIIREKNNLSSNNCILVNGDIKKTIIDFVYNKKLDNASI
jgi:hypothetical protein